MKVPIPMPADELLFAEMSKSVLNNPQIPQNTPGSNPWLKYVIVGGLIVISGIIAYQLTKPNEDE